MSGWKFTGSDLRVVSRTTESGVMESCVVEALPAGTVIEPPDPLTQEELLVRFVSAMESHYDMKARERKYDNRFTCSLRAGYVGPFQAEGKAFAQWMDTCNVYGYDQVALVLSGQRTIPTVEEIIYELPPLVWPN